MKKLTGASKKMRLALALVAIFVCQASAFAQDRARQIDALLSQYHKYHQFNGSALVSDNGKVIYKKGFGLANMEWNIPNEPDTKFRLGLYESYTGDYELAPKFIVTITFEDGKLMAAPSGQPKAELYATSATEFFLRVVDAQITFVKNEQGQVTELILHQNGRNMPAKKIR